MKVYRIAIVGSKPSGAMFEIMSLAQREIMRLKADDRRYAAEALSEAGIIVSLDQYEIVECEMG